MSTASSSRPRPGAAQKATANMAASFQKYSEDAFGEMLAEPEHKGKKGKKEEKRKRKAPVPDSEVDGTDYEAEISSRKMIKISDKGKGKREAPVPDSEDDGSDYESGMSSQNPDYLDDESSGHPEILEDPDFVFVDDEAIEDDPARVDNNDDYAPFDGDEGGVEDDSVDEPLRREDSTTRIPGKFICADNDRRLGLPPSDVEISPEELQRRRDSVYSIFLFLISQLQEVCRLESEEKTGLERNTVIKRLTNLFKGSSSYLCDRVMDGIPDTTIQVIGQEGFTIDDLLKLLRLSNKVLSEPGVYLNILRLRRELNSRLYVGSATGKIRILQRWHNYTNPLPSSKGRHIAAIKRPGTKINLRHLAQYHRNSSPWLPILSEGLFMLLFGTVSDPGYRHEDTNNWVNDSIYTTFNDIRRKGGFSDLQASGLNSTWTFSQGWRGRRLQIGPPCHYCERPYNRGEGVDICGWR